MYTKTERIIHWLSVIIIVFLAFTAVMNEFWYSKTAIIESIEFSFGMLGLEIPDQSDLLFIARMERREGWEWHFWAGALLGILALIKIIIVKAKKQKRNLKLNLSVFGIIAIMTVTGIILYIRSFWAIDKEIVDISRAIHYYSSWLFGGIVIGHIINVIRKEVTTTPGIISRMINGGE